MVCSYCHRLIREKAPLGDTSSSHSICPACFDHYAAQWDGLRLGEFLDRFELPVVALDMDVRVTAINKALARRRGIHSREAAGLMGGELFECDHARRPEGCGRSVHCKGCAVRNVVVETISTGEPQSLVPASLLTDGERVDLHLSSYQREGTIFLIIEPVPS